MKIPMAPIVQDDETDCGITCLRMILGYHGYTVSDDEIKKLVGKDGLTPFETDLARFANYKGLEVDCLAYNLYLTDPNDPYLYPNQLIEKLDKERSKPNFDPDFINQLDSTIAAIKSGVKYLILKPSLKLIKSYLDKNVPLIISVNSAGLYGRQTADPYATHAVVVNGIEEDSIYIIDPSDGKEIKMNQDDLMMGIMTKKFITASSWALAIARA